MLPETPPLGSAADWLRHARSDLCFHTQQAVEKSIKAVLIHRGIEFRKIHHINYLIGLLPAEVSLPPEIVDAVGLTTYAVMSRYPGDYEKVTEEAYQEAVRTAQAIFAWAGRIITGDSQSFSPTHVDTGD